MASRAEITAKYAKAYAAASKKDKGRILDQVVAVTGWSRDNARRRLVAAAKRPPGSGRQVAEPTGKRRADTFSYDARKALQKVWAASGGQCGKYLAASMRTQLGGLERHAEPVPGRGRYSAEVREELLAMSAASIDRYLDRVDRPVPGAGEGDTIRQPMTLHPESAFPLGRSESSTTPESPAGQALSLIYRPRRAARSRNPDTSRRSHETSAPIRDSYRSTARPPVNDGYLCVLHHRLRLGHQGLARVRRLGEGGRHRHGLAGSQLHLRPPHRAPELGAGGD